MHKKNGVHYISQKQFFMLFYILVGFLFLILLTSCNAIDKKLGIPEDNVIEQAIEKKIYDETGVNIDLTP